MTHFFGWQIVILGSDIQNPKIGLQALSKLLSQNRVGKKIQVFLLWILNLNILVWLCWFHFFNILFCDPFNKKYILGDCKGSCSYCQIYWEKEWYCLWFKVWDLYFDNWLVFYICCQYVCFGCKVVSVCFFVTNILYIYIYNDIVLITS